MSQAYLKKFAYKLLIIALLFSGKLLANGDQKFVEGIHFKKLPKEVIENKEVVQLIQDDPEKIQVIEFFSYACHGCYHVHPHIVKWSDQRPEYVAFYQVPVVFNKGWDVLAKAYFTAIDLGTIESMDQKFFRAIQHQSLNLGDPKILKQFFVKNGVKAEEFEKSYNSFNVERKAKKADEISVSYHISVTPTIVVNGPSGSYIFNPSMVGGGGSVMVAVLNQIIDKETELLAKKQKENLNKTSK